MIRDGERRGEYLAALSSELAAHLEPGCLFIRWDLPWISPYAEEDDRFDDEGFWLGPPETRLRELRMNWGSGNAALRKAPSDILPPDTIIIDLKRDEDAMLAKMRPKTLAAMFLSTSADRASYLYGASISPANRRRPDSIRKGVVLMFTLFFKW